MIESHYHNGFDTPKVNAKYLTGPAIIRADAVSGVSAIREVQPTLLQTGFYTLAAGTVLITFPQVYSETTTLHVLLTPDANATTYHRLNGVVTSAFTVSGSGSENGHWLSLGYK